MAKVLVVCTGNLCRSPMAAALLGDKLARDPDREDWRVESAGVWAYDGRPASAHGIAEMRDRGLDVGGHLSRPVSRELVEGADLVLVMTHGHVEALKAAFPDQAAKVYLLTQMVGQVYDIADPYLGTRADYAATARDLEELISAGYDRIVAVAESGASDA